MRWNGSSKKHKVHSHPGLNHSKIIKESVFLV